MTRAEFSRAEQSEVVVYPYRLQGTSSSNRVVFDNNLQYDVEFGNALPPGCPEELRGALSGRVVIIKAHKTCDMGPAHLWYTISKFTIKDPLGL